MREQLSTELEATLRQVQVWFQNRRQRERAQQLSSTAAAGLVMMNATLPGAIGLHAGPSQPAYSAPVVLAYPCAYPIARATSDGYEPMGLGQPTVNDTSNGACAGAPPPPRGAFPPHYGASPEIPPSMSPNKPPHAPPMARLPPNLAAQMADAIASVVPNASQVRQHMLPRCDSTDPLQSAITTAAVQGARQSVDAYLRRLSVAQQQAQQLQHALTHMGGSTPPPTYGASPPPGTNMPSVPPSPHNGYHSAHAHAGVQAGASNRLHPDAAGVCRQPSARLSAASRGYTQGGINMPPPPPLFSGHAADMATAGGCQPLDADACNGDRNAEDGGNTRAGFYNPDPPVYYGAGSLESSVAPAPGGGEPLVNMPGPVTAPGSRGGHDSAPGVTPGSLERGPIDLAFSEIEDLLHDFPPAAYNWTDRGDGRRTVGEADPEVEDRSGNVAPRRLRPPPQQGLVPLEDDIHARVKRLRRRAAPPLAPPGAPI